jgi:hypothetical protein
MTNDVESNESIDNYEERLKEVIDERIDQLSTAWGAIGLMLYVKALCEIDGYPEGAEKQQEVIDSCIDSLFQQTKFLRELQLQTGKIID